MDGNALAIRDKPPTTQPAAIPSIGATTDLTAVPGSFADLAAVRSYVTGANVIPGIEARLDTFETKVDAILTALRSLRLIDS